jgi:hypothetical protein
MIHVIVAHAPAAAAFAVVVAVGLPTAAAAQEGELSLRIGVEQTSGDYGGTEDLEDSYVPLTVLYERERLAFRLTVPYLEVEFLDPIDFSTYTESGLGDVVLGLTAYDVFESSNQSVAIDLTGKVELGTADEEQGLGTGETDYSLHADIYKYLSKGALVVSAGYKIRGEPAGVTVDDTWLLSFGGLYRFSTAMSGGVFLDYRESSVPGLEAVRELSASLSRRLDDRWRLQGYLVRGLSDTSLDWGAGLSVRRDF